NNEDLADVAVFLAAQADHDSGDNNGAETLLRGYTTRYPDSIFADQAPELEATVLLALGNSTQARSVLNAARGTDAEDRPGFKLAEGQVQFALGEQQAAISTFKKLLLDYPLKGEAQIARARLTELGAESTLTLPELRGLGDAYYSAGRYNDAQEQYRAMLAHATGLSET